MSTPGAGPPAEPSVPFHDGRLELRDGRALAWRRWGDPEAPTVLRLQGAANGRQSGNTRLWHALGISVLAADRPGFGHSTRRPGRGLRVVADDLAELLDTLALDAVPVIGHSAGGPHALALAAAHAERVSRLVIVSGACHLTAEERAGVVEVNRVAGAAAARGWDALHEHLVGVRRSLLADEAAAGSSSGRRVRADALRQGAAGWTDEAMAIMGPWDFALTDVRTPVTWFHGVDDDTVPISAARRLCDALPSCTLVELPERGHRSGAGRRALEHLLQR